MQEVEYDRALARAGGAARFPERLDVPVDPQASRRVDDLLRRVGVAGESLVLVHAGALNGEAKRWPPKYWARFADELQRLTPSRVALIGARGDLPIAQQVIESAAFPVESFVGSTTIEELVALIARADLIATGDSGPLHLAVALGRPLVAVYGPTDPAIHGPFQPTAPVALHRRDLPCSPCYTMAASAECPLGDPICMRLVTVPEVVESAMRLLNGSAARAKDQLLVTEQDALEDAERR